MRDEGSTFCAVFVASRRWPSSSLAFELRRAFDPPPSSGSHRDPATAFVAGYVIGFLAGLLSSALAIGLGRYFIAALVAGLRSRASRLIFSCDGPHRWSRAQVPERHQNRCQWEEVVEICNRIWMQQDKKFSQQSGVLEERGMGRLSSEQYTSSKATLHKFKHSWPQA